MKGYYAGLDIGGTNGRLKICGSDGEVLGEFTAPGCSLNTDGAEKSRLRYRDLVLPALQELHLDPGFCLGICVAASGIDSPSDEHDCRSSFEEMGFPHERLLVLNDCEVFLHFKCPVLTPLIIKGTGLDTLEKIDDFINANLMEKSEIARLSLFAYQAAALGDHEAVRIHRECGDALWGLIRDTKAKMAGKSPEDKLNLWLWGSVLVKNDIIRSMVEEKVRVGLPGTEIGIPEMSALDTALKAAKAQETERRTL